MKRLVVIAIMAAFLLGTVGVASAAQIQVRGDWQMSGNYVKNPTFDSDAKMDPFQATQRLRTAFEYVANENLKGVFRFHVENRWGEANRGIGVSNQQAGRDTIGYDLAYLDFMIPNTQVNIKAGKQLVTLPGNLGSHILDDFGYSVIASTPFNDMVGLTIGWTRADDVSAAPTVDADDYSKDEFDIFYAIVPVTMDGVQLTPFAAYGRTGKYWQGDADGRNANHYWIGLSAAVDMFDPIVVMADFNWGGNTKLASDEDGNYGRASGWIAALAVQYNMDLLTPMIYGLYEHGESRSSARDDRRSNVMPSISGDLYGLSSFGAGGTQFRGMGRNRLNVAQAGAAWGPTGKWGVGLKLKDITFVDKLSHEFQAVYYQGTNHRDNLDLFTTADKAWEVNFNTQYQMYENLAAILELGYMAVDMSARGTDWRSDVADDAAWKAAAGFRYRF